MNSDITNILLVGVGGQGILLASEILSEALMLVGYDVKKSEIHGMSQRGGSVVSHVRYGKEVFSPIVPEGEGDVLFGFELMETCRAMQLLRPGAKVIANNLRILPPSVLVGKESYPDGLENIIQERFPDFLLVDGQKLANDAGNPKTANTALLGAVSRRLDIAEEVWFDALRAMVSEKVLAVNIMAFKLGREYAS